MLPTGQRRPLLRAGRRVRRRCGCYDVRQQFPLELHEHSLGEDGILHRTQRCDWLETGRLVICGGATIDVGGSLEEVAILGYDALGHLHRPSCPPAWRVSASDALRMSGNGGGTSDRRPTWARVMAPALTAIAS
jgi:hypothetical protein